MTTGGSPAASTAAALLDRLAATGQTVAVAESLTGGLVLAALTEVPGASAVVRGGVVAYALDLKAGLLGVERDLLERTGAVDPEVARAMAAGVRSRLAATWGLATTGEAGPGSASGRPVGTVHLAVVGPGVTVQRSLHLPGGREAVRAAAVAAAIEVLAEALDAGCAN
jgi:nicotinamide-nucleotide amidase